MALLLKMLLTVGALWYTDLYAEHFGFSRELSGIHFLIACGVWSIVENTK